MLNRLVDWSLDNRPVVLILAVLLVFGGGYAVTQLPIDAVPDVTNVQVQILTKAPALGPAEMEQFVTYPVEAAMNGLPDLVEIRSISRYGLSAITVVFEDHVNVYFARQLVSERLSQAIKFNTDLDILLSACETGLGKVIHAEGVMSLARAFFGAGVKSGISTLWEVNDRISKDQVIAVYKNLLKGLSKPDAIRIMQMEYISNVQRGQYALPYYWASYQCQGNTDAIFDPPSDYLTQVLGIWPIVSFSFIGLTFYLLRKSLERINF